MNSRPRARAAPRRAREHIMAGAAFTPLAGASTPLALLLLFARVPVARSCDPAQTCAGVPCTAFQTLSCLDAAIVFGNFSCTNECVGCCTDFPAAPPSPVPPSPGFPLGTCPWEYGTSEVAKVFTCFDGTQCGLTLEDHGCCACHGGRALCPPEVPKMCNIRECGDQYGAPADWCCDTTCDNFNGTRPCDSEPFNTTLAETTYCNVPSPPLLPPSPPSAPQPPHVPMQHDFMAFFAIREPRGVHCEYEWHTGDNYKYLESTPGHQQGTYHCANECLNRHNCTGFQTPTEDPKYCILWFNHECSGESWLPYAYPPYNGTLGPASGPLSVLMFNRLPHVPDSCLNTCADGSFQCVSLLSVSCPVAEEVTRSLNCSSCGGCCAPLPPPASPAPSPPPPPGFPSDACPWEGNSALNISGNSGENWVFVCMDGHRCNQWSDGVGCCACHGGHAKCPLNVPFMCNQRECGYNDDYCCNPMNCDLSNGPRPCPSPPAALPPALCAIPSPPATPPAPRPPPWQPYTENYQWQYEFNVLKPEGTNCDWHNFPEQDFQLRIYVWRDSISGGHLYLPRSPGSVN